MTRRQKLAFVAVPLKRLAACVFLLPLICCTSQKWYFKQLQHFFMFIYLAEILVVAAMSCYNNHAAKRVSTLLRFSFGRGSIYTGSEQHHYSIPTTTGRGDSEVMLMRPSTLTTHGLRRNSQEIKPVYSLTWSERPPLNMNRPTFDLPMLVPNWN